MSGDLTAGKQSPGVNPGQTDPQTALRQLLAGTGLQMRALSDDRITLMPVVEPSGDTLNLSPINVAGRYETAYGPVEGYKASRSATATKTDTPLIETPAAIQVIPREVIEDQGCSAGG